MSAASPDYTDIRIKHLEMIQAVIARMSVNSGTVKRYAMVITAAAVSLGKFAGSAMILIVAVAVVILFALLDARYLRLERCYRDLFNAVRSEPPDTRPDFRLTPDQNGQRLVNVLKSWSVAGLYGVLVIFMLAVMPFLKG
jgi:hypothetical protein